ncbi:MAG: hypothetical protein ACOCXJ_09260 [Planctomycetota bacterium]
MPGLELSHRLLVALASAGELGFAELRRDCGDPVPATLSRALKQLLAEDLVVRGASGRYRPGPAALALAELLLGGRQARIEAACRHLAAQTRHSALCCGIGPGGGMLRLARSEVPDGMAYGSLDEELPLLAMAFGIPLLEQADRVHRDAAITAHLAAGLDPITELDACRRTLRAEGVLQRDERLGTSPLGCTRLVAGVADQDLSLGITLLGRSHHHDHTELVELGMQVRAAAAALSQRLPDRAQEISP